MQFLIEKGANIDLKDKEGNTALISAAKNGILIIFYLHKISAH